MLELGGFRIEGVLGSGGMGTVYAAVDLALDRRVAIKVLHKDPDPKRHQHLVERLRREAKAAARIQSPHTAQVLQLGETDTGEPFIVMEHVDGRSLRNDLAQAPFAPARAVAIARQVCAGMAPAHALGIIHRDLKPGNILLVDADGTRDFVKILDFGVAKLLDERALTEQGTVLGTFNYMAPEQLSGQAVDERADVYAVGLLLFEMLTGEHAFKGKHAVDLARQEEEGFSWTRCLTRRASLPSGIVEATQRALAADRELRLPDMRSFDDALARGLDTPPIDVGSRGPDTARMAGQTEIEPVTEISTRPKSEDEVAYETERGAATLRRVGRGVVLVRFRGVADERIFRFVREAAEESWPSVPVGALLKIYFDTTGMSAFEKIFRKLMVAWHSEMKGKMEQVVLVRSRIVAGLVQSANKLIGGGAEATANRDKFERGWADEVLKRAG